MLTAIILMSFIAAAFWREALKLVIAAVVVVLLLGLVQVAKLADEAGLGKVTDSIVDGR